tara:strand:+ start:271 stop:771 length:501 start_codon:yes stop_codon:yes gene_type:complete
MYFGEKDARLQVNKHPFLDKTLVAKKTISKNEIFWYWGDKIKAVDDVSADDIYTYTVPDLFSVNPLHNKESLLKYANIPGPLEENTLYETGNIRVFGNIAGIELKSKFTIPRGYQVTLMYGDKKWTEQWFKERKIDVKNIETFDMPTLKKKIYPQHSMTLRTSKVL